jgi:hypothetical protein
VGRAPCPNRWRFRADDPHGEQDKAAIIGNGQLKIRMIPEVPGGIAKELASIFDGLPLGVLEIAKLHALVVLHAPLERIVRVEKVPGHDALPYHAGGLRKSIWVSGIEK